MKNIIKFGLKMEVGIGLVLIDFIDLSQDEKIFSEVYFENERAFSLYKIYGFKEYSYKIVNGKRVICMELKRKGKI